MSKQTNDLIDDLLTSVVKKEPKKRGPKPKTDAEKEAKKIEQQIKKKAQKEEATEAKKKPALDKNNKQKTILYLSNQLRKDDPDYPAIHEKVEKNKEKRSELYDSLFRPVTTATPIKKYETPMDEVRRVMKVINEEEEKERKKQDRLKKIMEDDEEEGKMYVPMVSNPYPRDIISQLINKSNQQNTGKGIKKKTTKNKKSSKRKSKTNRNSKRRV
jgi:hypothetical protein